MLISIFLQNIVLAVAVSIMAFVYKEFLLPDILQPWARIGDKYERIWFYKPVWGCFRCIAGQLAMWFYILTHLKANYRLANGAEIVYYNFSAYIPSFGQYSIVGHLMTICAAILFTDILTKIYNNLSN